MPPAKRTQRRSLSKGPIEIDDAGKILAVVAMVAAFLLLLSAVCLP